MCAVYDSYDRVYYTRPCVAAKNTTAPHIGKYWSQDLNGLLYDQKCPYFDCCAKQKDDTCDSKDSNFTFAGRVGKVVAYDQTTGAVSVTFNNNRTSYSFSVDDLKLETYLSMYEVWWVQRTRSEYIVQYRKGFNVTSPTCTYDVVNSRYSKTTGE